ncbi:hypothetical protein ABT300_43530, partial [Streptomyces sp. NPDC001027]|uniref:hypothetical protein n=1 Tax=Streptomyces sp. NPDC001027 TaxID=3154771 RepID=UPI003326AAD2
GEQLLRLSMDLATGSAGVLLALGSALADTPALPFWTGRRVAAPAPPEAPQTQTQTQTQTTPKPTRTQPQPQTQTPLPAL